MIRDIEKELGIGEALAIEASAVSVRVDKRRYGKAVTILEGFDGAFDVRSLAKSLKNHLGTGGTTKNGAIELQGDHRVKARVFLEHEGFSVDS